MLGCLCWAWWTWYRSAFTPSRSASIEDIGRGNVVLRGGCPATRALSTASLLRRRRYLFIRLGETLFLTLNDG